jgi:hypothetical protein
LIENKVENECDFETAYLYWGQDEDFVQEYCTCVFSTRRSTRLPLTPLTAASVLCLSVLCLSVSISVSASVSLSAQAMRVNSTCCWRPTSFTKTTKCCR